MTARIFLTQTGTDIPAMTVFTYNLPFPVWMERIDDGVYYLKSDGMFKEGKTWVTIGSTSANVNRIKRFNDDIIELATFDQSWASSDNLLLDTPMEIIIKP